MLESQRMIPLATGKRTGIKLTNATWQAIELLAVKRGITWREWCAAVIEAAPDYANITAIVRDSAIDQLLNETVFNADRANDLNAMALNAFTRNHGVVDDDTIAPYLAAASGQSDFGGFSIFFGVDDEGNDFLAVRNGLRGGVHFLAINESDAK